MTDAQLAAIEPALVQYLSQFRPHCVYAPTFGHLNTYVRGLLSDLPRKTAEPVALAAGTPVRTLQEFLKDHAWGQDEVRVSFHHHVTARLLEVEGDDLGVVGLIDETSALKKGTKTPGVHRQYLGCVGKVANGIVTVHLGLCKGRHKTLVDWDLFLPEAWSKNRKRCEAAGIPDAVVYRPKWEIALEQLKRANENKLKMDWLTFDSLYGGCPTFLSGVDELKQKFVGEAPRTLSCCSLHQSGQPPSRQMKGQAGEVVVRNSSQFRSQDWRVLRLRRETMEDQVWRVKAGQVWLSGCQGWSDRTYWLVWASNDQTGEEKFFVSNASLEANVETLMRVAFRRANVEHAFRVCKSELGFTHFEGRNYKALMRHLCLCVVTMGFVAEHTDRLRGEKPRGDDGAGESGREVSDPRVDVSGAANDRPAECGGNHPIPSATQSSSEALQAA
jgi:SRSO17 transposase